MQFRIPLSPIGKERPRFVRGHVMTGKKTSEYEKAVSMLATAAMPCPPYKGPVEVAITSYLPVSQSWPLWKRRLAGVAIVMPTKTPDIDNIAKAILDGMNGIAFKDDSQIVSLRLEKRHTIMRLGYSDVSVVPLMKAGIGDTKKRAELASECHRAFARLNELTEAGASAEEIEAAQQEANRLSRLWGQHA